MTRDDMIHVRVQTPGIDRWFTLVSKPEHVQRFNIRGTWFLMRKKGRNAERALDAFAMMARKAAKAGLAKEFLREADYRKGEFLGAVLSDLTARFYRGELGHE